MASPPLALPLLDTPFPLPLGPQALFALSLRNPIFPTAVTSLPERPVPLAHLGAPALTAHSAETLGELTHTVI